MEMQDTEIMQTLTPEFMKEHSIAKVISCFGDSGQKLVCIIEDNRGRKLAMKSFRNCTKRDIQEIKILKRFKNLPGISKVVKVKEHNGSPLLFEEYIDGRDLQDMQNEYTRNAQKIAALIKNIASILEPIWLGGIVHRDLKPKNIKILQDGSPVIMDFGIARDLSIESITQTGDRQPMTWDYASPEQYTGDKRAVSYRTDFFALGLIAYKLFYGNHPFGNSQTEIDQRFQKKGNTIYLEDNPLKSLFEATLVIEPSGRVRDVGSLVKLL